MDEGKPPAKTHPKTGGAEDEMFPCGYKPSNHPPATPSSEQMPKGKLCEHCHRPESLHPPKQARPEKPHEKKKSAGPNKREEGEPMPEPQLAEPAVPDSTAMRKSMSNVSMAGSEMETSDSEDGEDLLVLGDDDEDDSGVENEISETASSGRNFVVLRRLSNTFPFPKDCLNILDVTGMEDYEGRMGEQPVVMVTIGGIVNATSDEVLTQTHTMVETVSTSSVV